ncbi:MULTISPECIES: hypothetical protein [Citrobacter freundii complex]|uniref:Uncharacterized protein n=1 Tax=Citrobacter youngae ATCC 29220 TaxID=500640 RepID=D4BDM6_9ENTR|nr:MULTISPECIES: hypothetical protein [Citrobacter freundii complex]EFE08075.1 hypothetical protein CIT292_08593 [Citrobacter youngae ATCC 29220]ELD0979731.1 hypothetical protein [Citrobacter freundii]
MLNSFKVRGKGFNSHGSEVRFQYQVDAEHFLSATFIATSMAELAGLSDIRITYVS